MRYADVTGTVLSLCYKTFVLPPLQDPRQAWATTLEHSTAIDQSKTAIRGTPRRSARSNAKDGVPYSYCHTVH